MIIDRLSNCHLYSENDLIREAFTFLNSLQKFPEEGKISLKGDNLFANIDKYSTKPASDCRFEAHQRFIDIQMLFSGQEIIYWHPSSELKENIPYDTERDVAFFELPPLVAGQAIISPGIFMLLYPEDAHMPQIAINDLPEPVAKIVMKIKI